MSVPEPADTPRPPVVATARERARAYLEANPRATFGEIAAELGGLRVLDVVELIHGNPRTKDPRS